jgi:hypothetical protein
MATRRVGRATGAWWHGQTTTQASKKHACATTPSWHKIVAHHAQKICLPRRCNHRPFTPSSCGTYLQNEGEHGVL